MLLYAVNTGELGSGYRIIFWLYVGYITYVGDYMFQKLYVDGIIDVFAIVMNICA